jgi:hypothetical protein
MGFVYVFVVRAGGDIYHWYTPGAIYEQLASETYDKLFIISF